MKNQPEEHKPGHRHKRHLWLMGLCCGLPIAGFLAIALLGLSLPSLETALLFVCPVGMIAMMYFMHRDGRTSAKGDNDQRLSSDVKSAERP